MPAKGVEVWATGEVAADAELDVVFVVLTFDVTVLVVGLFEVGDAFDGIGGDGGVCDAFEVIALALANRFPNPPVFVGTVATVGLGCAGGVGFTGSGSGSGSDSGSSSTS